MPSATPSIAPGLSSYLKSLKTSPPDACLVQLISLLQRRQISQPRQCAIAITQLLLRYISSTKFASSADLLARLHALGRRLTLAQPHEPTIGNIVRRALGLVREITDAPAAAPTSSASSTLATPTPAALQRSQSSFFSGFRLASASPGGSMPQTPYESGGSTTAPLSIKDVRDDVLNGLREMLDELDQADEQVAGYALEHVAAGEVLLTLGASRTIHKLLLAAAKRRRFTLIHVEGFPSAATAVHEAVTVGPRDGAGDEETGSDEGDSRIKALRAAGVTVILVPDAAAFAVMPRVSKVLLPALTLLPDGSFIGAAGARTLALTARAHRVPVLAVGAVYKLSPVYPYDAAESIVTHGDPGEVVPFADSELVEGIDVLNPLQDHVPKDLMDLVLTNIGAYAPSYMYRISADHYRSEDIEL